MKIAIIADTHIIDKQSHPDRLTTFGNILSQCEYLNVSLLVVAGDLFDKDIQNFADFEATFKDHSPDELHTIVIPGNHDPTLTPEMFSLSRFEVINEPVIRALSDDLSALFIPYNSQLSMGEAISPFREALESNRWLLFGHGDWTEGLRLSNTYEQGGYMPLTQFDVLSTKPLKVFLGHIHLPYDSDILHYSGSPCPIDITETGTRRLLLFDTENHKVESKLVDTPQIFYNENFVVLPDEAGIDRLIQHMKDCIGNWDCPENWLKRVKVRVTIKGYSSDRQRLKKAVENVFSEFRFYNQEGPKLDKVIYTSDLDRAHITEKFKMWLDDLNYPEDIIEPTKDEILLKALSFIYGV